MQVAWAFPSPSEQVALHARPAGVHGPSRSPRSARPASYMFTAMYWPLIGGFIAFVLLAVLMGWIMDRGRHGDADHDGH